MRIRWPLIGVLIALLCAVVSCKNDVANTGQSVLDKDDAIIVLTDTFSLTSRIDSCEAIISQADSFLLGEIETDYGLLRASILTQLSCPEGYTYPEGFCVDSVDSICLFMYYSSWVGDGNTPMAINVYRMDRKTFDYSATYRSDLSIDDYCSRDTSILMNHRIIVASEKRDSVQNSNGDYMPMIRMRTNDEFVKYFASIQSFESQESFNDRFKGLLIESSFGSSAVLNISDIALGVFYHFSYSKAGRDTVVSDMKAFYANSEIRTVNQLTYPDKKERIEALQKDSDTYNYIIAPAGAYTRMTFPMRQIADSIMKLMRDPDTGDTVKRAYVNKAEVFVKVENMNDEIGRNAWLKPSDYMLLIRESSVSRFFKNKELPTDTCALLAMLSQTTDSVGNTVYYYSYDMSDLLTNQLRQESNDTILNMILMPVTVETSSTAYSSSTVSSVRQQQTMSATKICSANNGMRFEIVFSGF